LKNRVKKSITLVSKDGSPIAILRNPEIYANRKEEIVARVFGVIDPGHPYISHIYNGGDWLIGGEVELLDRIRYNDGLDRWRLTAREVRDEFARRGADVVYAFQTRNPTHAGHAYLMKTAGEKLREEGYNRPVLWLSPLGGWTKSDDVPLDVRVNQHEAVLRDGMLDPDTTVMAIWPAPMIYAGPTEVQFHAKSRRSGGASFFVVGRDPAGMKGSAQAESAPDDDLYDPEHGRYVLAMSPGSNGMRMLDFSQVYYDKKTHTMTALDSSRPDDFISISGSKMRKLAAQGAKPCRKDQPIPSDLLSANCIPPGFMVQSGWEIVCDYYQHVDDKVWVPFSRNATPLLPPVDPNASHEGLFGSSSFKLYVNDPDTGETVSPWHDVDLITPGSVSNKLGLDELYNMIVEIPAGSMAKMEVQKDIGANPIMQDTSNNEPRYFTYGVPFFNYGLLPQTWEDPISMGGRGGDNDPLDVIELGLDSLPMGSIVPVKILGSLELIDEGETDHKILAIRASDPIALRIHTVYDLDNERPGTLDRVKDWLVNYKTTDGKPKNSLANEDPTTPSQAADIVNMMHQRWRDLVSDKADHDKMFCLTGNLKSLPHCTYPQ
jgi:3'-phosphoadenosine 5'-phosphosulfate synthase